MKQNIKVAKQLLVLARELLSMEFNTEAEMKKYKQDHDVRPGTKLTVKKTEGKPSGQAQTTPAKPKQNVPEHLADEMSGDASSLLEGQFIRKWYDLGGGTESDTINTALDAGMISQNDYDNYWKVRETNNREKRQDAWDKVDGKIRDSLGKYWESQQPD